MFFAVHTYFSVIQPSLVARNINLSLGLAIMCIQLVWLLSRRVAPDARVDARMTSGIFAAYVLFSIIRIAVDLTGPANQNLFQSGLYDTLVFLVFQMLQIGLTLSLVLLVTRRLQSALERDIAERRFAEEALRLSEQKFSVAFENIPDAIVVTALADGRILDVNQGFQRMSEYSKAEAIGKTTTELALWADPADRDGLVRALREAGGVVGFEATFTSKSGGVIASIVSAALMEIGKGQYVLTVIHDATKSKRALAALARSEAKFATAFQTSPDAVNINPVSDGMYLDVNEGFTKLTGYTAADVLGSSSADIQIWENPTDRETLVAGLASSGIVHNLEARFRRKDGTVTTALMSAQLIDLDGERCILSVTRDISDRKRAEEEIVRLNEDLEERVQERTEELTATNEELAEATRAKDDFLAAMSHELRTPLNSVIGFSDLLGKGMVGDLNEEQRKQIGMIHSSGMYLLELVNEVLDLSAIEAGQMRIEHAPLEVTPVVREVVESLAPLAEQKALDLSWEVSPEASTLVSDRTRLEQVLFNLIGNAIKFTDSGSVRVDVRRSGDEIVFSVSDTGFGIARDDVSRVFEEFYQVQRHDVAKSEGTGLGLSVSRRLVEMLGGAIDVESEIGVGSTFTVRLPAHV